MSVPGSAAMAVEATRRSQYLHPMRTLESSASPAMTMEIASPASRQNMRPGLRVRTGQWLARHAPEKIFALQDGEKVFKFEAKAHEHDWFGNSLMVRAIRLSTNQGRTFSVPDSFDAWVAQSGTFVEEIVPIDGWELKGWYGGGGDVMDRVGAIWGVALALR